MTNYTLNNRQGYTRTIASIFATLGAWDGTLTYTHTLSQQLFALCSRPWGTGIFLINFNKFDCSFSKLR